MEAVLQLLAAICLLSFGVHALPSMNHVHSKFEFTHSFKGPYMVNSKGHVPFWTTTGSAIASDEQVRVCPSLPSSRGGIWNNNLFKSKHWMVDVTLRVTGRLKNGADGMAIWFVSGNNPKEEEGPVFGHTHTWRGLGVMLDSFDNDVLHDNPKIQAVVNDGTKEYEHHSDGLRQETASCNREFRNRPHPVKVKIVYLRGTLEVWVHDGLSLIEDDYELCTKTEGVSLPTEGYLGITAATGGLSDDHDALSFVTHSLTPFEERTERLVKMMESESATGDPQTMEQYKEMAKTFDEKRDQYRRDHPNTYQDRGVEVGDDWQSSLQLDQSLRLLGEMQVQLQKDISQLSSKLDRVVGGGGGGQALETELISIRTTENNILHQLADLRAAMDRSAPSGAKVATSEQLQPVFETKALVQQNAKHLEDITQHLKSAPAGAVKCPTYSEPSCISPFWFAVIITFQTMAVFGYILYRQSQERAAKKFF